MARKMADEAVKAYRDSLEAARKALVAGIDKALKAQDTANAQRMFDALIMEHRPERLTKRFKMQDSSFSLTRALNERSVLHRVYRGIHGRNLPEWDINTKTRGNAFVRALGLRVPGILAQDIGVDEIRLVPGHVVKPTAGGNSKGVFSVEADGSVFDVGENERISADEAMQRIRAFDQARKSKRIAWNIEERISGPDGRSPVDLKFYAFYGELPIVTEVQRQPFKAFNNYLENGEKISTGKFDGMTFDGMAPTAEEYAVARKVSLAIKVPFLRIDFMRAGNGELVFCEFTPRPGNFDKHNSLVDRLGGRYFVEAEARLLAEFLR